MERLRSHGDFVAVLRGRKKVASKDIVVHYLVHDDICKGGRAKSIECARAVDARPVLRKTGLAVSKAVGNAVVRNTVKRRFRVLAKTYEDVLPLRCDVVLRAKPSAARTSFQSLDAQILRCFSDVQRRYQQNLTSRGSR